MRVTGFPAGMFQTNCYVVSLDDSAECFVVDPGQEAAAPLYSFLDEAGLVPVAVLLTHGHLDHMWDATPVCAKFDIPLYVHPDDRHMLTDPASGIGPVLAPLIANSTFEEPASVIELAHDDQLSVAGIDISVSHTPGHTRGSVVFGVQTGEHRAIFSGDTLFAGSIGRSDLPGGNHEQLLASIETSLLCLDDETTVLPGHGETTSIGAERAGNPFLTGLGGAR